MVLPCLCCVMDKLCVRHTSILTLQMISFARRFHLVIFRFRFLNYVIHSNNRKLAITLTVGIGLE